MRATTAHGKHHAADVSFTLEFNGSTSANHRIDLYDVSQALIGFQRSIALTTHLVLNNEIITQSPSLKGAVIYGAPPEEGSWKMTAVVATTLFSLSTAQSNSPLGHILFSMYDWAVSESLGFHVDFNKSLGVQYEALKKQAPVLPQVAEHQADSLIEKLQRAIEEMHRPIVKTRTATSCVITGEYNGTKLPIRATLDAGTYDFIHETLVANTPDTFEGRVSSYNSNTFKGRIYVAQFGRPVSFELQPNARSKRIIQIITTSLFHNALKQYAEPGSLIHIVAFQNTSKSGTLKSLTISKVSAQPFGQ